MFSLSSFFFPPLPSTSSKTFYCLLIYDSKASSDVVVVTAATDDVASYLWQRKIILPWSFSIYIRITHRVQSRKATGNNIRINIRSIIHIYRIFRYTFDGKETLEIDEDEEEDVKMLAKLRRQYEYICTTPTNIHTHYTHIECDMKIRKIYQITFENSRTKKPTLTRHRFANVRKFRTCWMHRTPYYHITIVDIANRINSAAGQFVVYIRVVINRR